MELRRGYDYIDPMAILERGLTPELFHTQMQMIEGVEGKGNRTGAVEQMKNIYDLNYTGAAVLYQNYQDKLAEFGGDRKKADEYFSGDEWKKTLEDFKENREFMSKELEQLNVIKDIQKYTQQIGQWHLDTRMDTLRESLVNAFNEAREKGKTNDTDPGKHANPYPEGERERDKQNFPQEQPAWKSIDTNGMAPAEAEKVWLQEHNDALKSGDDEQITHALRNLELAQTEAMAPLVDPFYQETRELGQRGAIEKKTKDATKYLFAEHTRGRGNERSQMNAINDTVKKALDSGKPAQYNAANEFADIISPYVSVNYAPPFFT